MDVHGAGQLSLLVIDGSPTFADSVAGELEAVDGSATVESLTTDSLGSTAAVVEAVRERDPDGLVVGDTVMETVDVVGAVTEQSDLPVVLLSGTADDETLTDAVEAGVADVFPRSTSRAQAELAVKRLAAERESGSGAANDLGEAGEDAYGELFETVSDGLVVHDPATGEILDVNGRFCEMHGYERDTLVGESVEMITAPGEEYSYDAARDRIEQAREDGPQLIEWRNQREGGDTFPIEGHLAVIELDGVEHVLVSVRDITERKRREREFEQIFNSVPDIIAVHDPETGDIIDVNDAYTEKTGYDRDTILELGVDGISVTGEAYTKEASDEIIDRVTESGDAESYEWQVEFANGDRRWLEGIATAVTIGGEQRVLTINRDITERRHREREFEAIFNGVHDQIGVFDPETYEMIAVNERMAEVTGYDRERILEERNLVSATDEGYDYSRAKELIDEVASTGEPKEIEWHLEAADGDRRIQDVRVSLITIEGEERVVTVSRDVTERRRREREFEQIFDGVHDGIMVMDPETLEITEANETSLDLFGYDDLEAIQRRGIEGVSVTSEDYTAERAQEIHRRVAQSDEPEVVEWRIETAAGERRWLEVKIAPAVIGGEDVTIAIHRDITERKRREREYEQVFNSVQDAITIHDPETYEMVDVNDTFCEFTGYDRETVLEIGTSGVSVGAEGYTEERAEEIIDEVLREGQKGPYEWMVETKDGEHRVTEVVATTGEIGGESRIISINRDITERKRRQQEYEQIFNMAGDGIVIHDPESGEIVDANQQVADLLGYDRQAFFDRPMSEFQASAEQFSGEQAKEKIRESAETGGQEFEWALETSDGETVWVRARHETGEIDGERRIVALLHDITERKRRERIIRSLHDATDQLQEAETREAVCEATVAAARTVLGLSLSACWLPNEDGSLRPAAGTDSFWEAPGGPMVFEEGSFEHEIYQADELVTYEPSEWGEQHPFERLILVPLGDHGLFGAGDPTVGAYDEVTLDAARILARHARSALDRVERSRELRESERRFRTIAERVDEIIYLADADTRDVLYLSPGHQPVWGRDLEGVYDDPTAFTDAIHPDDYESFMTARQAMFEDIEAGEPDDSYTFSYRIERPDGELRWIETTGYPIVGEDDRPNRYVAMVNDVTEQHRREQTLETFHEATRELTAAESPVEACQRAVHAAEDVLGFPLVSAYLYDEETGELTASAITSRLEELDVELPAFGPGDSLAWEVFVQGESTTSSEGAANVYGPGISGPDIVLPLGSHGVMLVGGPSESFDSEDVELAQILAATLEAALNHVAGEQTLEERNAELQRQQERADRLEQLNAIIRDIEQATVDRSSRAGIEQAVCDRLTDVAAHDLVWIAEPAVGNDDLVPQTSAGEKESYVDAIVDDIRSGGGGHPAVEAYRRDEPRVIENVATEVPATEWRKTALQHGIQSVVALPIRYDSKTHGVLTVTSEQPGTFDVTIQEVLADLGRSIGYAITIAEREHALESEGTTELEFTIRDDGLFLVRAASMASCRMHLQRTIRRSGGSFSMFYVVEGAAPTTVVDLANSSPGIETAQVVSTDETGEAGLIEVTAPTWFGSVFTEHGAVVREAECDRGEGHLVVEAPRGTDVRTLVEGFQERYPESEFVAQYQRDRAINSLFELQDILRDELTARQWEALETAYSAGYFEWPREIKSEETADLLGVSQPTFNKHLRTAEKTAFEMLLDREYPA